MDKVSLIYELYSTFRRARCFDLTVEPNNEQIRKEVAIAIGKIIGISNILSENNNTLDEDLIMRTAEDIVELWGKPR